MPDKTLVSQAVKDAIQKMIFTEMKAGERLPTEAELTALFNVSRTSVREAVKALEAAKIVEKRNGGTYVVEQISDCFVDSLYVLAQLNVAKKADLLSVRQILEGEAAFQAALHADQEIIRKLKNNVWMMQRPDLTQSEYIDLDMEFHLLIAEGSNNSVLFQLIKDISTVLVKLYPKCCTLEFAQNAAIPVQIKIAEAINNHNGQDAKLGMVKHLRESDELLNAYNA